MKRQVCAGLLRPKLAPAAVRVATEEESDNGNEGDGDAQ
jgi:hypothetical protein